MVIKRERVLAKLAINSIPPGLCWGKPVEFVKKLVEMITVTLRINPNNDFIVIGHQTPTEDDKGRLWIRRATQGAFLGFYLFIRGRWQRVFNYRNDEIIWMWGDSTDLPDGFKLVDGFLSTIPTPVQEHIIKQYHIKTSGSGPSPVYDYFATTYIGII